jgi:hypothetical protein
MDIKQLAKQFEKVGVSRAALKALQELIADVSTSATHVPDEYKNDEWTIRLLTAVERLTDLSTTIDTKWYDCATCGLQRLTYMEWIVHESERHGDDPSGS